MSKPEKQQLATLQKAIPSNSLMVAPSAPPAVAFVGLLALVWSFRRTVFGAKLTASSLLVDVIGTRDVGLPNGWAVRLASRLPEPSALIETEEALVAFLTSMGSAVGPLALALQDAPLAASLFPVASRRQLAIDSWLGSMPNPPDVWENAVPVIAALWKTPIVDVADLVALHLIALDQPYVGVLATAMAAERATVISAFTTKLAAAWEPLKAADSRYADFSLKLSQIYFELSMHVHALGPSSKAVPLAAVAAAPAPAPAPAEPLTEEKVNSIVMAAVATAFKRQLKSPSAAPTVAPAGASAGPKCYRCGAVGHIARICPAPKPLNKSVDKYIVECSAEAAWPPGDALLAAVEIFARSGAEPKAANALFDTGAPYSAISVALARSLGCVVTKYAGPALCGVDGAAVTPSGQTALHRLVVGAWSGALGPIAVVPGLPWPLLVGLADMRRCASLSIDFTTAPPRITLQPRVALAAVSVDDTLSIVSEFAAATDADLQARAARDAAAAHAIPPTMSAAASRRAAPAIDARSPAETAYRRAFVELNRHAYKEVELDASLSPTLRSKVQALLYKYRACFAVKDADWKPPVIDTTRGDAYPLQLFLLAGKQAKAAAQPPFQSRHDNALLERERDTLLRTGRAVPACRAPAIAASFVVDGKRVVYAMSAANALLYATAHTLPSTEAQARELAERGGGRYFALDLLEGFLQWVYAVGSGAAACVSIGGEVLEPLVPSMGIHCVPGEFHALVSRLFKIRPSDIDREPALGNATVKTFIDDFSGVGRDDDSFLAALGFVLQTAHRYGFTFNARKARIGSRSVVHAGHLVEGSSIRPLHSYTDEMLNQGRPESREQLVRFLGQAAWILPHLSDSWESLAMLRRVLKSLGPSPQARIRWSESADAAFHDVRASLADPRVLYAFDPQRTLFVMTDASKLTGSCIFMQLHNDADGRPLLRVVN